MANLLKPLLMLILRLLDVAFMSAFLRANAPREDNRETSNERVECSFHICKYYIMLPAASQCFCVLQ